MRTYTIESIKTPISLVYAKNEKSALDKYAKEFGYKNGEALRQDCIEACGPFWEGTTKVIDVERISLKLN